jgi:hypothetical protein
MCRSVQIGPERSLHADPACSQPERTDRGGHYNQRQRVGTGKQGRCQTERALKQIRGGKNYAICGHRTEEMEEVGTGK